MGYYNKMSGSRVEITNLLRNFTPTVNKFFLIKTKQKPPQEFPTLVNLKIRSIKDRLSWMNLILKIGMKRDWNSLKMAKKTKGSFPEI